MPYKSDAQRRYMHAKHPDIAARWDAEIRRKKKVSKAKPQMTDAELKRRKKVQAGVWRTTSTMGLTGLGITAASIASKKPGNLVKLRKVPGMGKVTHEGLKDAALYTSMTAGGIGGVGGFNSAKISSEEARRRQFKRVQKSWQSTSRSYDPEAKRHRRSARYEPAAAAASVGAIGAAGHFGAKSLAQKKKAKQFNQWAERVPSVNQHTKAHQLHLKGLASAEKVKAAKNGARAGRLAVVGGGAAIAGGVIHQRRKSGSWASYAKSATSAFGVDHND